MASTKLRLLLDESITEPLRGYILRLVPSAKNSMDLAGSGAKDPAVVACANTDQRMIVAIDSDFNGYHVKQGVIKLNGTDRASDQCLYEIFYAFWKSGLRGISKTKRVSLTREGVRITNGKPIEKRWHPKPCSGARRSIRAISTNAL